ncbi:hypothetical protein N9C83_02190 [Opitutales bacterium]|nr:hypothetical protein [Opitutales bacterium]
MDQMPTNHNLKGQAIPFARDSKSMSQHFTYASASGVFFGPHAKENDASLPT